MIREDVVEYFDKKVKITTKSNMYYSGKVLNVTESVMVVDDWKVGKVKIDFFEISSISEDGRR